VSNVSSALLRVSKGDLCAGCGLCEAVVEPGKINMQLMGEGYLRPTLVRTLSPMEDSIIAKTCPGLRIEQTGLSGRGHAIWGSTIGVRAGHATDSTLRHHASSGGVLSALLLCLLETGKVDYVVQTAASPDSPIQNSSVQSFDRDQVYNAAGSRYAPSAPLRDLRRHLERPGQFAFVGKPCDVAALRAYGKYDARVEEKIPFVISFFCAGIPSSSGSREILARLGVKEDEVADFRYRGDGWPGFATARTNDGRVLSMSYAESWGDILSNFLQFRCKICPDGNGRFADLVCADAWYGDEKGFPRFSEAEGRSLVISRTKKGEAIVNEARKRGYVELEDIDLAEVEKMQPYQARRNTLVLSRLAAMALLGRPIPRYPGFQLTKVALRAGVWGNAKSFLGMARRLVRGRWRLARDKA
jgi:coenzyme F420 hydrogenase subunit beta